MSVSDLTTLALTAVPVYNSNASVTQSLETSDRWRAMRGIPEANEYGYDLGSAVVWNYTTEAAVYNFLNSLATHCTSVSATGCYAVAGCPVSVELLTAYDNGDPSALAGTDDGLAFDFVHLIANAKAIQALGYCPRVVDDGAGGVKLVKKANGFSWEFGYTDFFPAAYNAPNRASEHSSILENYNDTDYDAAIAYGVTQGDAAVTGVSAQFIRYKSTYTPSALASVNRLLGGWVGYYTHEDVGHPTFDQSRIILGRAMNAEGRASALTARKVLLAYNGTSATMTDMGRPARSVLLGKKFQTLGLDLTYWCDDTSDSAGDYLLPWSGTYSNWTSATLTAGTATGTKTYDFAIGAGFANDKQVTWEGNMTPTANAIFIGGLSNNGKWGKRIQVSGGHSAIIQQIEKGGTHANTAATIARQVDAGLALIAGKTLAEAAWLGMGGTLMAIGDPLARPLQ